MPSRGTSEPSEANVHAIVSVDAVALVCVHVHGTSPYGVETVISSEVTVDMSKSSPAARVSVSETDSGSRAPT